MTLSKNVKYLSNKIWEELNQDNKSFYSFYIKNKKTNSKSSLKQYESALRIFLYWVYSHAGNVNITELKKRNLLEYQNWLLEQGLNFSSIKFKRSAVSNFFEFIATYYSDVYPDFKNFMNDIPLPLHEFVVQKVYVSEKEMNILREELRRSRKFKQLAFAEISYATGMTKEEILALNKDIIDIHYNNDHLYPIYSKGVKHYISEEAMKSIREWLDQRGEDLHDKIFISKKKGILEPLNPTVFNYWCSNSFSKILGREIKPQLFHKK